MPISRCFCTLAVIFMALAAAGQDERNTNVPNTDTHFALPGYKTLADWEARRPALRRQILNAAGLWPMPEKTPLHPQVFGRLERDGYTIEKAYVETLPGYYMGGNLYRPRGRTGPFPAILIAHGHWDYGRVENQQLNSTPKQGITMARQGYVVFAYDMVGYNDTIQTPHEFGGRREQLWSFGPLSLQLWNSIRALDFVLSLPDVDAKRVGITGASGGGTQTMLLTAVDDRIAFAAPVNMVSAIMQGGCVCENAPGLRIGTSNVEIAALAAPRPMILISGPQDWTKNVANEEYPAIRRIYDLYGKTGNVSNAVVDAPHNYNRESREHVYRFLGKHVLHDPDPKHFSEPEEVSIERLQDMLVLQGRSLPAGALTYDELFAWWRDWSSRTAAAENDVATIRERLASVFRAESPGEVEAQTAGTAVTLSRKGRHDRVPGMWVAGQGVPALVVHPGGIAKAQASPVYQGLIKLGRPVLTIDAFQTGAATEARDRSATHFLTFNVTDDAARVQDLLTALAYVRSQSKRQVELIGLEESAVWALFAAAISPDAAVFTPNLGPFRGTDDDYIRHFFVPGIQKAGGIDAALKLVRSRAGTTR